MFLLKNYFDGYIALLKTVEVFLKGGNTERKAVTKIILTVSGCLPAQLTALSRLMTELFGFVCAEVIVQAFMSSVAGGSLLNLLDIQSSLSLTCN